MTKSADEERKLRKALVGSSTEVTNYRDRAVNDIALEAQGRHSAAAKATVTGAARVPLYPAASGPWNDPVQVPQEPSLGYAIDSQEPTGEPFEIAASVLAFPSDADASAGVDDHSDPGDPAPTSGMSHREVGALSPNVIVGSPSDNPTNAEVGGEAGRHDVGGGITGHGVEGPLSMTLAQRAASNFIRRARKL